MRERRGVVREFDEHAACREREQELVILCWTLAFGLVVAMGLAIWAAFG